MSGKLIPVETSLEAWRNEPGFAEAYDALGPEFDLASALIRARGEAGLSQDDVARRMQTSQPAVARLEGGRGNPSVNTLRRYAAATGARLRIVFDPLS